ncbi:MAG: cobalamin biosynthesis protein CobD [Lachnospiraceae bacterium]|nr:cobalamin biosynthesis protein CobD [Lachnospiraceae bacterium]
MTILTNRIICLAVGFLLDVILGDPYTFPHPVRWIGSLITFLDRHLRKESDSPRRKRRRGLLLVILMLLFCGSVTFIGLYFLYHIHRVAGVIVESILCYQMLSMKCLKVESMKVYQALQAGDAEQARKAVSMIVGRDTERLDEAGIAKAAVETVAENASDGVIAPMFYLAIGGGVLGILYKTINTMDSMIGYKNEKYLNFGRYAAKLDDIVNYIPGRLAALLMIAGTGICRMLYHTEVSCMSASQTYRDLTAEIQAAKIQTTKPQTDIKTGNSAQPDDVQKNMTQIDDIAAEFALYDMRNAWHIYRRDRYNHASPNSAQTESVCAGALGLQLAGDAWYFGKKVEKPYIGDALRPIEAEDIRRANRLLYAASFLMWLACMGVLAAIRLIIFFKIF